ncbi:MAG: hypothetical protein OXT73_01510 [Bacteroidota bacterium]|nr:hypothetical protein [Bacteroidota bacterium]
MRISIFALLLAATLVATTPAQAQLRSSGSAAETSVRLYDQGTAGFSLNRFFTPEHFRMSHTFEASSSSWGGGSSMAMYTNSMMWQFSSKLAARLDVAAASQLGGNTRLAQALGQNPNQVFIRNAEIAYRPTENIQLHLRMRRSPYGSYMSPYGSYNAYDRWNHSSSFRSDFGPSSQDLFWNDRLN